jgi:hypothetical protein
MSPSASPVAIATLFCPHCLLPQHTADIPAIEEIPTDILATNRPPLDPEILCIQSVISEELIRKACLDARIASLTASLDKLTKDRDVLEGEIHEHRGALSPLRRLPTELISLIFVFTRPSAGNPAPWTVSQVCRRWRAISISQPSFWTSVVLDFGRRDYRSATKFRLETHLERSGDLPLDIVFRVRSSHRCTKQESVALKLLAKHSARWEKVVFTGHQSLYAALSSIRGNLPILRNLQVELNPYYEDDVTVDVFQSAPNLSEATVLTDGSSVAVNLPFHQLHLYCAYNTWDIHLSVLRFASNLVECALHIDPISTPPATITVLPNLLRLFLSEATLLEYLDAPSLQELYCSGPFHHLSSVFEQRPPHRLQKLVFFSFEPPNGLTGILRAVPTLTDLGLSIPYASANVLCSLLTIQNAPTDVGLALRSITISLIAKDMSDWFLLNEVDSMMEMVESRWRKKQLSSIILLNTDFRLDGNKRVERLRTEGLDITSGNGSFVDMIPPRLRLDVHKFS